MKQKIFILTLTLVAVTILSGCGSDTAIKMKSEEKTVSVAKLPQNFPKDIFVYQDAHISDSQVAKEDKNAASLVYYTKSSPEESVKKYKEEMAKNKWTLDSDFNSGEKTGQIMNFKKGNLTAGIIISANQNEKEFPGKAVISINVKSIEK